MGEDAHERFVVFEAERLAEHLMRLRPSSAVVLAEGGGWSAVLPGLPVHGDGESLDEALADLMDALREYGEDWNDRLRTVPNHLSHRENLVVATIAQPASDNQLRSWLLPRTQAEPPRAGERRRVPP